MFSSDDLETVVKVFERALPQLAVEVKALEGISKHRSVLAKQNLLADACELLKKIEPTRLTAPGVEVKLEHQLAMQLSDPRPYFTISSNDAGQVIIMCDGKPATIDDITASWQEVMCGFNDDYASVNRYPHIDKD